MTVLFESRDTFLEWIEAEEFRHHAPGLMAFVKHHFERLFGTSNDSDDQPPSSVA
ncbi:hypothetical protein [Variovorax sp. KK3]|uniref:hypothetical protein n=1 Tax=Variovorax sp. KK3 TaxID=1855728 RepID=UPI0015C34C32|nr:hypothetical protein [Variovorax sp. KK3]